MHSWTIPMYPLAFVARIVGLTPNRVRRWLQGYEYTYATGSEDSLRYGYKGPVIARGSESNYATFLDLIDMLFVKKFLDQGISLQRIRLALKEAEELLGGKHFAHNNFFTTGKNIYLQIKDHKERSNALMQLLSGGQWVIQDIILDLAKQIDFHKPSGFAQRWYPFGLKGHIVLDPMISFGRPSIVGRAIATANVYDFYQAEKENIKNVTSWFEIHADEVDAAVNFEQRLKAA